MNHLRDQRHRDKVSVVCQELLLSRNTKLFEPAASEGSRRAQQKRKRRRGNHRKHDLELQSSGHEVTAGTRAGGRKADGRGAGGRGAGGRGAGGRGGWKDGCGAVGLKDTHTHNMKEPWLCIPCLDG